MATYQKGGSTDTWTFSGNVSVGGTMATTGAQTFSGAISLGAISDAAGFALTDSVTRGAGLFTELPSTGTAISAGKVIHGVESRLVINKDQTTTNDTSIYALTGHLRVKQDLPQSSCFGTWAYFEQSGIVAGSFGGALRAKVEAEAGLTQAKVYGVLVDGAVADAATIATDFAAIRIATDIEGAGGMKAWRQGILIDGNATTGITMSGTITTGMALTGSMTTGINVAPSAATTGISVGLTGKTYTTGILASVTGSTITTGISFVGASTTGISMSGAITTGIDMTGAMTTGINVAPSTATTGISIGVTGKTYATALSVGVAGSTLTAGIGFNGTITSAFDFTGLVAANGEAISTSGSAATTWAGRIKVLDASGVAAWINVYSTSNEA